MTSQTGKQIIVMHIFPDISQSKGNQRIKFGQFTEYNLRNIFLEKLFTQSDKETIPRPFFEHIPGSID